MSALAKKLQIKPGHRVLVFEAPDGLELDLPDGASFTTRAPADVVLLFARDSKLLAKRAPKALGAAAAAAVLWIAYPKTTSGVGTDLTRDRGWEPVFDAGFGPVSQVAIDATWSALRFRPEADVARKPGSLAPSSKSSEPKGSAAKRPAVAVPRDLIQALAGDAAAKSTWSGLAPSHVREYVSWIEEAKKPETRARRVGQTVEMLRAGVRDRNERYRT